MIDVYQVDGIVIKFKEHESYYVTECGLLSIYFKDGSKRIYSPYGYTSFKVSVARSK